jgi:glycosyltransferase involved in cell wall biosynthesis
MDDVTVIRFQYFLPLGEHLAYDGGILANIKKNRSKILLVPFFLISQLIFFFILCARNKFDLIHTHWIIPQGLVAVFSRQLFCRRAKVLCTSHGGDLFSLKGGFYQAIKQYVFNNCNYATVVSNAMKQHLQEMDWNTEHVSVQSMGVDLTTSFIPDSTVEKKGDLVFVGRLVEKKGVATLIDALGYLAEDFPSVKLTIVGDGPDRALLEQQVNSLGLDRHVEFTGARPNDQVPRFYQSAKIAVVPSVVAADGDQEGLGLVAVEAMGCGCATIASDLPALGDVITHDETGLVFRSGDARDLAAKIRRLLLDPAQLERLASDGRRFVEGKFDWNVVGSHYRRIIEACMGTRSQNSDLG